MPSQCESQCEIILNREHGRGAPDMGLSPRIIPFPFHHNFPRRNQEHTKKVCPCPGWLGLQKNPGWMCEDEVCPARVPDPPPQSLSRRSPHRRAQGGRRVLDLLPQRWWPPGLKGPGFNCSSREMGMCHKGIQTRQRFSLGS